MSSYNDPIRNQQLPQSFYNASGRGFDSANRKSLQPLQTSTAQKRAKSFLKQGLNKLSRGDYSAALENFQQALRVDPNFIQAYICQSLVHYYQEDYQSAIADCNQALQIQPQNVDAYNNRGLNRCALGEYKDAIADFNHVLEIDHNHVKAYLNRGYSRLQLDDNWGAIEDFDQALRLDPTSARVYLKQLADTLNDEPEAINDANGQLITGLLIKGNLRYESGDYPEAIALYNQVLSLDPNNSEAYNRRSTARSGLGDYEGACEDLYKAANYYLSDEQSSELTPIPTVEDLHQCGVEKLQQGDFTGAIKAFNQVIQLKGEDAKAFVCRGFSYQRLGDNLKAIQDLEQGAKLFSEQGDVKSSRHILNTLKKLQE